MRGCANEFDDAALNVGQQNILLRLVEAMDFVNEKNGRLAGIFKAVRGDGQNTPHVGDVGFHAAQAFKFAFGLAGDDLRERSFAGAGRAVKDERLDAVGFDGPAEKLAGREHVGLPGVFVEVARAHPCGERLAFEKTGRNGGFRFGFNRGSKQIIARHGLKLASGNGLPKTKKPARLAGFVWHLKEPPPLPCVTDPLNMYCYMGDSRSGFRLPVKACRPPPQLAP